MERSEHGVSLGDNGSLVIGSASASHSGDFKCVATNEAGSVERKTRLKVNGEILAAFPVANSFIINLKLMSI